MEEGEAEGDFYAEEALWAQYVIATHSLRLQTTSKPDRALINTDAWYW